MTARSGSAAPARIREIRVLDVHLDVEVVVAVVLVILVFDLELVMIVRRDHAYLRRWSSGPAIGRDAGIAGAERAAASNERNGSCCDYEAPVHAILRERPVNLLLTSVFASISL
jgi:hypothetical protein